MNLYTAFPGDFLKLPSTHRVPEIEPGVYRLDVEPYDEEEVTVSAKRAIREPAIGDETWSSGLTQDVDEENVFTVERVEKKEHKLLLEITGKGSVTRIDLVKI